MKMRFFAPMLGVGLLASNAVLAQDGPANYLAISGGASMLRDSDNAGAFNGAFTTGAGTTIPAGTVLPDGTEVGWMTKFNTGFAISAAYGRRYGPFRGEMELVWQRNNVDTHVNVAAAGIPLGGEDAGILITGSPNLGVNVADLVADGQGDVRTIFIMANAIYDFRNQSPLTPYVGGGVGAGFTKVDYSPSGVGVIDDRSTQFAWQVTAGVSWAVAPTAEIYAGYRYRATSDVSVKADLFSADFDIQNRASIVEGGLRWWF